MTAREMRVDVRDAVCGDAHEDVHANAHQDAHVHDEARGGDSRTPGGHDEARDARATDAPPVPQRHTMIESPFVDHLGARLVRAVDGQSEVALPLVARHLNTWGVVHGGVTMTLADIALAMAARSLSDDGVGVVTVEMKVNFMQPGRGELRASARVLHRSTTMAYCEGEVRDSEGHFVAKALGTFKYTRRLAVGREVVQQRLRSDPRARPGPSDG